MNPSSFSPATVRPSGTSAIPTLSTQQNVGLQDADTVDQDRLSTAFSSAAKASAVEAPQSPAELAPERKANLLNIEFPGTNIRGEPRVKKTPEPSESLRFQAYQIPDTVAPPVTVKSDDESQIVNDLLYLKNVAEHWRMEVSSDWSQGAQSPTISVLLRDEKSGSLSDVALKLVDPDAMLNKPEEKCDRTAEYRLANNSIFFNRGFLESLRLEKEKLKETAENTCRDPRHVDNILIVFDELASVSIGTLLIHEMSHAKQHCVMETDNLFDNWRGHMEQASHYEEALAVQDAIKDIESLVANSGIFLVSSESAPTRGVGGIITDCEQSDMAFKSDYTSNMVEEIEALDRTSKIPRFSGLQGDAEKRLEAMIWTSTHT